MVKDTLEKYDNVQIADLDLILSIRTVLLSSTVKAAMLQEGKPHEEIVLSCLQTFYTRTGVIFTIGEHPTGCGDIHADTMMFREIDAIDRLGRYFAFIDDIQVDYYRDVVI